jgi:uncharacterized protein YjfI (DUF2170 family)
VEELKAKVTNSGNAKIISGKLSVKSALEKVIAELENALNIVRTMSNLNHSFH